MIQKSMSLKCEPASEPQAPNYDRTLYKTERTFCIARDGVKV